MAGYISKVTIEAVNRVADIVSIVGDYVQLTKRGSDFWGCCPFHHEKTASFHVIPDKGIYYCFGCQAGGNAIKFIQEMENIPFTEAVIQIAKKAGVEIIYESSNVQREYKYDDTKEKIIELYDRVASMFHYFLMETPQGKEALDYLYKRGLTKEIIEKFKLGYAVGDRKWLKNFLRSKNFSDDFLNKSGLFSKNYPDSSFFCDRVMCPIFDRRGQTVAFSGRILHSVNEDTDRKYLNTGEMIQYKKRETLYGFNFAKNAIRTSKTIIFCEGNMDVIAYHQAGIEYAVATCGTALTEDHLKMIQGFAETILLSFDGDTAGQNATYKSILMCRKMNFTVKVIRLQGGKDPSEILLKFGKENLSNQVNSAIIDSDYLFDVLSHQYPIDTPEGKTKAALAFFPYIDALQSDIQKESSLEQMGQYFNIASDALHKDFYNRSQASNRIETRSTQKQDANNIQKKVSLTAELRAILAVIADVNQYNLMRQYLTEDDFEDPNAKELFIILEECYRQGDLSLSTILDHCQNENIKQVITISIASGEYSINTEESVKDSIVLIRKNSLERRRSNVLNQIRILQSSTQIDETHLRQLLEEKMNLDQQLK